MKLLKMPSLFAIVVLFCVCVTLSLAQDDATTTADAGSTTAATTAASAGRVMTIEDDDNPVLAGEHVYLMDAYLTDK